MDWEIIVVYVMLALTVVLFVTDRVRTDIVGLLIIVVLGVVGILEPKDLLLGFSNEALVTIAAMFVLSAALMRSGLVTTLGGKLADFSRGSPLRFMFFALSAVCFMSAFINNTPVVVVFIPAVLTVCARLGASPSKFLMPISFASMLGGSCTLIGTSSNILIASYAAEVGFGIGMFEFAGVGLAIVVVGMCYLLLFSWRLLPNHTTIASTVSAEDAKEYITQVSIGPDSDLIGKKLPETSLAASGIKVAELIRGDRVQRLEGEMPLEENVILLLRGSGAGRLGGGLRGRGRRLGALGVVPPSLEEHVELVGHGQVLESAVDERAQLLLAVGNQRLLLLLQADPAPRAELGHLDAHHLGHLGERFLQRKAVRPLLLHLPRRLALLDPDFEDGLRVCAHD